MGGHGDAAEGTTMRRGPDGRGQAGQRPDQPGEHQGHPAESSRQEDDAGPCSGQVVQVAWKGREALVPLATGALALGSS